MQAELGLEHENHDSKALTRRAVVKSPGKYVTALKSFLMFPTARNMSYPSEAFLFSPFRLKLDETSGVCASSKHFAS